MPTDLARLRHIRDAIQMARRFTAEHDRGRLDVDPMLSLALLKLLEIIGEAAKNVSAPVRAMGYPIPWREMAGTRDRLSHGYFDVNLDVIWDIVTLDLPSVEPHLDQLITAVEEFSGE